MNAYLASLTTEKINKDSVNIDICNTQKILKIINNEDKNVPLAVEKEIPNIAKAVDKVTNCIKNGGRLFYVGAGTSGRIGILDASECPPTFGTNPELIEGIIAGGEKAIFKAIEGAEDSEELGKNVINEKDITNLDAIVGITASGRTPFVLGAIKQAKKVGAVTIGISNNENSKIKEEVDISITPLVGPEVVMGSTRMKSGTSQKLILNMITTASMIKLGKVYKNFMVDLKPTNMKLIDRAERIVMYATDATKDIAKLYLEKAENRPKVAIVMIKTGCSKEKAERLLQNENGFVTNAIKSFKQETC